MKKHFLSTKQISIIAIMSALAGVLMVFDFPLTFIAPSFYRLDFSDLPCVIGTFSLGPLYGVLIEIIKILIKLLIKPTSTAFVGELSNLLCGISYVYVAGIVYNKHHNKKGALISLIVGTLVCVFLSVFINYFITIPFYVNFYRISLDEIINLGKLIFPFIYNKLSFVCVCVLLFNTIKMTIVSIITYLIYKKISNLIKSV